jgi:hypothetical protein
MQYLWVSLTKGICSNLRFSEIITNMKGEPVQNFTQTKANIVPPNNPALGCNLDRCSFYDHRLMIDNKSDAVG